MELQNLLLVALPVQVRERLATHMRIVELKEGEVLHRAGEAIRNVYFPLDCLITITVTMYEARTAEAGIVGNREMVGVNAFMGGRETNQTEYVCQAGGKAIRMESEPLLREFDRTKEVRDVMLRFTQAYIAQLSQNVACNRLHTLKQRLARWMLECRDRLASDDLSVTQEFIAQMLGVHRPVVSETMAEFQGLGLVECGRKKLRVMDAPGLQAVSCECFGVIREECDRLLGPLLSRQAGVYGGLSKPA
jgi:CRP-like cAMP-binding protein